MPEEFKQDRNALVQRVKTSLQKAENTVSGLKKTNTRLFIAEITSSGVSTLVAGITSAHGPVVGEGIEGWRIACIVVAIFGFISTVIMGLNQQLNISDRLSEGTQCVGKLRSLDVVMTTGSRSWEEIVREYEEIVKAHTTLIS